MSFLFRWRASEKNLRGPDFKGTPWLEINLSGVRVKMKFPRTTAMIPTQAPICNLDIFDKHSLEPPVHAEEKASGMTLCKAGWNFYPGCFSERAVGGLYCDVNLFQRLNERIATGSLLNIENFLDYTLREEKDSGEWMDRELIASVGDGDIQSIEDRLLRYPKSREDIAVLDINQTCWIKYRVCAPGDPGTTTFRTAITPDHYLNIYLTPDCYQGDYFSPAHNLQEAIPRAMDEFMQYVHIQLAPGAQQYLAAGRESSR